MEPLDAYANKVINALKCRNAVIIAPSPKGLSTAVALVGYIHAELKKIGLPVDLVQCLPSPITKESTLELMKQAESGGRHWLAKQHSYGRHLRNTSLWCWGRQRRLDYRPECKLEGGGSSHHGLQDL
jgi:hypothetical protein